MDNDKIVLTLTPEQVGAVIAALNHAERAIIQAAKGARIDNLLATFDSVRDEIYHQSGISRAPPVTT